MSLIEKKPKAKRIRIRKIPLKPTYASLKTKSMQENPICWIAGPDLTDSEYENVYVLRKLLITENDYLDADVFIDLGDVMHLLKVISANNLRFDERIMKATLSKDEFEKWCENFFIGFDNDSSLFQVFTAEARTIITLYYVFLQPKRHFLPARIARVLKGSKTFEHPIRGCQPIHCHVYFEGEVTDLEPLEVYKKEPELTPEFSANLLRCHEEYMTRFAKSYGFL